MTRAWGTKAHGRRCPPGLIFSGLVYVPTGKGFLTMPVGTYTQPPKPAVISEPIVRDANLPQSDGLATLQASAPAVLHEDPDRIEVTSRAGRHARTAIEFDRGITIHRQRHGYPQACIFLQIVALHPINGRTPARIVRAVHGHPYPGPQA